MRTPRRGSGTATAGPRAAAPIVVPDPFAGQPRLGHLRHLTDDTGVLQHGLFGFGDPLHGYTLDDNARALAVGVGLERLGVPAADLTSTYLRFVVGARRPGAWFANVLGYDRRWLDTRGTEDAQGHAVAALGLAAVLGRDPGVRETASELAFPAVATLRGMSSPRAVAHGLAGLCWLHRIDRGVDEDVTALADALVGLHGRYRGPGWEWYEPVLAYDNARMPIALLLAAHVTGDDRLAAIAQTTLDFLLSVVIRDDRLDLIGNRGWYRQGNPQATFDQQPVDAASVVEGCVAATVVLGDGRYAEAATVAAEWFTGRNRGNRALLDPITWACADGLQDGSVNRNQGAESALAPLQTYLALNDPSWVVPSP